ncbi:hypothetical protein [Saccharomonospora marina]|uniref:hypothetical protein n=1 Tax=Saccharomonospora marina TaxID=632569 RepID=UPI0026B34B13
MAAGANGGAADRAAVAAAPGGAAVSGALGVFHDANFIIDGKPSGQGSGGFTLSRQEAEAALVEARQIADDLADLAEEAAELTQTRAPADDPASQEFNRVGVEAFEKGAAHVAAERDYWLSLVGALERALGSCSASMSRQVRRSAGRVARTPPAGVTCDEAGCGGAGGGLPARGGWLCGRDGWHGGAGVRVIGNGVRRFVGGWFRVAAQRGARGGRSVAGVGAGG